MHSFVCLFVGRMACRIDQCCDGGIIGTVLTQREVPDPAQRIWEACCRQCLLDREQKEQEISSLKRKSEPGSWNSMGKDPRQPSLASSGCLISVHRGPCPQYPLRRGLSITPDSSVPPQPGLAPSPAVSGKAGRC